MRLVKIPLSNVFERYNSEIFQLSTFLRKSGLMLLLEAGAFIGGGFARQIVLNRNLVNYLNISDATGIFNKPDGDIDVFFKSKNDYIAAVNHFKKQFQYLKTTLGKPSRVYDYACDTFRIVSVCESPTKLCHNIVLSVNNEIKWGVGHRVKIQLVGEFSGDVQSVASTYDFTNVRAFITKDNLIFSDKLISLEEKKTLEIVNISSPLLASRVAKYLNYRNLDQLTVNSSLLFTQWLCRARTGKWDNHPLSSGFRNIDVLSQNCGIRKLITNANVVTTPALSILVGKMIDHRIINSGRYMPAEYNEVDLAIEEIGRRFS